MNEPLERVVGRIDGKMDQILDRLGRYEIRFDQIDEEIHGVESRVDNLEQCCDRVKVYTAIVVFAVSTTVPVLLNYFKLV